MKKTGIFGGSFNPIHNGHIALAREIRKLAALDEVWFVVSPHNPLKDADGLLPDEDRLRLVGEALKDEEGLTASDYEFHMPRPSYMLSTLQSMTKDYPDRQFSLIIGADNWLCFGQWYGNQTIIDNYDIVIYPRQGCDVSEEELPPNVRLLRTSLYNISSTKVRSLIGRGEPIGSMVPQCVADYYATAGSQARHPLISVIIPVYNKAEYVEECIRSVATQDFSSFEIIAVEDGSTDNSAEICDRLALQYPNLRVFHPENGGVTAARRLGYEESRGKFITFVDADDKMLPQALKLLYDEILKTGADEVVARYIDQNSQPHGAKGGRYVEPTWMAKQLLATTADFCVLWAVLFRRELLEGCLNTERLIRSGEDILMQLECLRKNPKVWFSDEVVYQYTMGLPNDRPLSLKEQKRYDDILLGIYADEPEEYMPYIVLHQTKMYENFLFGRQFDVFGSYYKSLRTADKSRLSLADRIVVALPPRLAYLPVYLKKKKKRTFM